MNLLHHRGFQAAVLTLGLLCVLGWSWGYCAQQRGAALTAAQDAATCQRLAQQIQSLRQRPSIAGSEQLQTTELARRIEQAARAAGIDVAASLVRIVPETPQRIGEGPYLQAPTSVTLRGLSLQQVLSVLHQLSSTDAALSTRDLRLSAPREGSDEASGAVERWDVELTICYLIYSPPRQDTAASVDPGVEGSNAS